MGFKVGDIKTWTSQSQGHYTMKMAKVLVIVPPNVHPRDVLPEGYSIRVNFYARITRDHETYLMQVGNSKRLYWPLVSNLRKA